VQANDVIVTDTVSVSEAVLVLPFRAAVTTPVEAVVIVPAVAVKVPLVAPDATVIEAGTVKLALLSDRATLSPPDGAALLRVTVQVLVPPEESVVGAQLKPLSVTGATTTPVIVPPEPVITISVPSLADPIVPEMPSEVL
jgi:hypothetical protein